MCCASFVKKKRAVSNLDGCRDFLRKLRIEGWGEGGWVEFFWARYLGISDLLKEHGVEGEKGGKMGEIVYGVYFRVSGESY